MVMGFGFLGMFLFSGALCSPSSLEAQSLEMTCPRLAVEETTAADSKSCVIGFSVEANHEKEVLR